MKTRTKQLFTVLIIAALAVVVYAGSVFAQESSPTTPAPTNMLQRMQERFGPEAWAQRVQRMTEIHGAAFVSQMMERMAQQESCPCFDDENAGPGLRQGMMGRAMMGRGPMGQGMMQQQPNGAQQGMMGRGMMRQGMMGRGMAGRGMQEQGRPWGFHQPMGPRFWNSTPDATATPSAQ